LPEVPKSRLPAWLAYPYAAYALVLFTVLALLVLVLILPIPVLAARRQMVRIAAKTFLACAGMRLTVLNADRLRHQQCVVVANHSSYLDGVVLKAALPPRFGFVIKREMSRVPVASLLLRRIGSHFVDRGKGQRGARDARKLMKSAAAGGAMAFFPEGTFSVEPGLMRFHAGAFVIAARAGIPVLPVVIRGTRHALAPGTFMPRPGHIEVELLDALSPVTIADESAVSQLRSRARQAILRRLGEPDLAPESPAALQ
jgi:1-acyl-sn-glycerol-3-phosphate acyltransferase